MAAGANLGEKLFGMVKTIGPVFQSYAPGLGLLDLAVGVAGAVILYFVVQSKIKKARKFRRDMEYGSARWGTEADIKPFVDPKFENNVILTGTEFLTMNTRPKIPANARNLNACVIGSSGSGKTRFWLTPQLLQAHSSYVVVDPKGGTLSQCGYFLQKKKGYKVKVFNSIDFSKSMHYNPMAYIKTESDVLKFVNALIANTKGDGKEGDEFWTKAETLLYCALVAYIVFEGPEEERNMNTLVEMINSMEVREDDEGFKNAVDYMFDGLAKRNPQHFAVRQYAKYKLASGKTAKSILISCGARLAPFDIAELREIMSYDELELDKLGDEKAALFFLISDTDSTYNFIVALAFSQMFNLLCERADNKYGGRLPHHVRVLWDEAANTGQVPGLEKIVAVIRSREISLTLFYQATRYFEERGIKVYGKSLTRSYLSQLLRNPVYAQADLEMYEFFKSQGTMVVNDAADFAGTNGCYLYQGRDVKEDKDKSLKDQILVIAPHEGFVSADVWLRCRKKLMTNTTFQNGRKARNTWLAGKIKCGKCGYALKTTHNPSGYEYLRCSKRADHKGCPGCGTLRKNEFEQFIFTAMGEKFREFKLLRGGEEKANPKITAYQVELAQVEAEIEKLLDTLTGANATLLAYANKKIEDLDNRRKTLSKAIADLSVETLSSQQIELLSGYLDDWENISFEDKRKAADGLISSISATSDYVKIEWKI